MMMAMAGGVIPCACTDDGSKTEGKAPEQVPVAEQKIESEPQQQTPEEMMQLA